MTDVVVVGAGLAGLSAALRAAELGARVTLLEKGGEAYPCNSRMSGGNLHVARLSPYTEPARLRAAIDATTGGWIDPSARDLVVDNAPRTVEWLIGHGAQVAPRSGGEHEQCVLHPTTGRTGDRLEPDGRGPDVLLRRLADELARVGVDLATDTEVTDVRPADAGWTVGTAGGARLTADRVVLADGGFQADRALAAEHLGLADGIPVRRNAGSGRGFGLTTCLRLGAATTSLGAFYGCLVGLDALTDPTLLPYPIFDYLARAGVLIDRSGHHVVDERLGGVVMANTLARHGDRHGWVIVDNAGWEAVGRVGLASPQERLADLPSAVRAATLPDLLRRIGLNPARVLTSADVGEAVRDRVRVPPYFAFPVVPAVTHTMGGPVVDTTLTVLDTASRRIPGLAAVGSAAGGFEGGPLAGYVGGLLRGAVTAVVWAEAAYR